jgi:dTDP-glucose 4,6-dehydratase
MGKGEGSIEYVADRPGHDRRYAMNTAKIEKELGWRPQISLEEGLRRTVVWYLENPAWWQDIKSGAYREYYQRMYGNR